MYPQELRKNSPYNNHQYQPIYYPFNIYGCLHQLLLRSKPSPNTFFLFSLWFCGQARLSRVVQVSARFFHESESPDFCCCIFSYLCLQWAAGLTGSGPHGLILLQNFLMWWGQSPNRKNRSTGPFEYKVQCQHIVTCTAVYWPKQVPRPVQQIPALDGRSCRLIENRMKKEESWGKDRTQIYSNGRRADSG